MSENCPTCQGTKHVFVEGEQGTTARRCPDCFIPSSVARLLTSQGYPAEWADLTLGRLATVIGDGHPLIAGVREFLDGYGRTIHIHAPPSKARQALFAVVLRGLLVKHRRVNVLDSAELSVEYFKKGDRRDFRIDPAPVVFTLGRELEKKIGAFYYRSALEFAVSRKQPFALFTDYPPAAMQQYYAEFSDLANLAGYRTFPIDV